MEMAQMKTSVFCTIMLVVLAGCDNPRPGPTDDTSKFPVTVSILPQAYFANRIGRERLDVQVMVPPGISPATYEPTPKQMAKLAGAKLFFSVGVPFERTLVGKITKLFGHIRIVETASMIDSHGENSHSHDPHTWLDPVLAKEQAKKMAEALIEADPAGAQQYQQGLAELIKDLDQLNSEIAELLKPHAGKKILVFHPAYGYFARRYSLKQLPIQIEGKAPSAKQLTELIETARASGFRIVFVQPQFSAKTASVVAEQIGAAVVEMDPLSQDYLSNLRKMAGAIEEGVRK